MTTRNAAVEHTEASEEAEAASYRYAAFISYRHVKPDKRWAAWLQRSLEGYRVPERLVRKGVPKRLKPVFRDEEELAASSDLSASIEDALKASRFLIVICSRRTPVSRWVHQEIVRFRELGGGERILALLVEGEPMEAFPEALTRPPDETVTAGPLEPLAADVRRNPEEKQRKVHELAKLRLLATLLGCSFDELRQREQERQRTRWIRLSALLTALLVGVSLLALYAFQQRQLAKEEARHAQAQYLAAQAQLELMSTADAEAIGTTGYARAALLALESLDKRHTVQGDLALRSALGKLPGRPQRIVLGKGETALALEPRAQILLSWANGRLRLWELGATAPSSERTLDTEPWAVRAIFTPDGSRVATVTRDRVVLWRLEPFEELGSRKLAQELSVLSFVPGTKALLLAGKEGVHRWDPVADEWIRLPLDVADVIAISLSGDGNKLAFLDSEGRVEIHTLHEGEASLSQSLLPPEKAQAEAHLADDIRLDHEGRRLALFGHGWVDVWDLEAHRRLASLPHEWSLQALHFSKDARYLATVTGHASIDAADPDAAGLVGSIVRVWDVGAQFEVARIPLAEEGGITWADFSADGDWLLTATWDRHTVWLWNLWPEKLRAEACARLERNLSPSEQIEYLGTRQSEPTCPDLPVPDFDGSRE